MSEAPFFGDLIIDDPQLTGDIQREDREIKILRARSASHSPMLRIRLFYIPALEKSIAKIAKSWDFFGISDDLF